MVTNSKHFVITIDGPAGSGKSTVSSMLAKKLRLPFLTTGALYRGLAYLCSLREISLDDAAGIVELAKNSSLKIFANPDGTQVFVDEVNVTDKLHTEQVAAIASRISAYPGVRVELLSAQRAFIKEPGLVAEGRDCGTVVFPDAQVKIFLTASLEERALRRSSDDKSASQREHVKNISARDAADTARKAAPLMKAQDAIEIDTSTVSAQEVVARIEEIVRATKAR